MHLHDSDFKVPDLVSTGELPVNRNPSTGCAGLFPLLMNDVYASGLSRATGSRSLSESRLSRLPQKRRLSH